MSLFFFYWWHFLHACLVVAILATPAGTVTHGGDEKVQLLVTISSCWNGTAALTSVCPRGLFSLRLQLLLSFIMIASIACIAFALIDRSVELWTFESSLNTTAIPPPSCKGRYRSITSSLPPYVHVPRVGDDRGRQSTRWMTPSKCMWVCETRIMVPACPICC
jgi:hypothetical protein